MAVDGFWLFEGLEEEPYGLLPLVNLSGKSSTTSTKYGRRIASYQWYLDDDKPIIAIPGMPLESFYWPGGKLMQDRGVVIYDVNHMKLRDGPLDSAILAARKATEKSRKPINFNDYDFITDAVNLQKIFAFVQEAGDGLFRIDVERIGKTVLFNRMEASDLMEIGHITFDQALKAKMTKPRSKYTKGPFFQLVEYQFGEFKILLRFEVDCADFAAVKAASENNVDMENEPMPETKTFEENKNLSYMEYGKVPADLPLQLLTTYPQGAGFPFFTWAQMFFTTADQEIVGWFKGNGDFNKPQFNTLQDISKLIKPLPYVVLSKVHDCLAKIAKFMRKNDPEFKCALVWKGKNHLEIFAKDPDSTGAVSPGVKAYLQTVCQEPEQQEE
uniref:RNA_ligase domain-containing protein n=1 Tax=Syphacia muris TaxID=451379 RepID=A0A0N5AUE5_9BILA